MRFALLLMCTMTWLATPVAADWVDERTIGIFEFHAEFPLRDIEQLVVEMGGSTMFLKANSFLFENFLIFYLKKYQDH